jgi:hypothetical protein
MRGRMMFAPGTSQAHAQALPVKRARRRTTTTSCTAWNHWIQLIPAATPEHDPDQDHRDGRDPCPRRFGLHQPDQDAGADDIEHGRDGDVAARDLRAPKGLPDVELQHGPPVH